MIRRLLLCALLVVPSFAHAQHDNVEWGYEASAQEQARADAYRSHALRVADGLADTGGSRELVLAAIQRRSALTMIRDGDAPSFRVPPDAEAGAWMRAAAARAGDDVIANQLLVGAARGEDSAIRRDAARRWQAAEPDNLMPLLYLDLPTDELLVQARRSIHVETHMYDGVRWMVSALLRHPPTPMERAAIADGGPYVAEEAAAISAMGIWLAFVGPNLLPLRQACGDAELRVVPARAADCRHVATLLADRSGSAMEQGIGLLMLRELAGSQAEREAIDVRRKRRDWQMQRWGALAAQQPRDGAEQFVRLLADPAIRTEQQLVERVLQEAGVSLEPPAGWTPPGR
ncbi:hypothetical protein FQY83_13335 [Luteimonas marina]|uniref:Secreted protein n=1 Tax=Luteimonas marina TaxID=488485 RepID=A0A5C5TZ21_9GAMM|nr:hypothetical protein [Luteimonas marina]TWT19333.1 hypothetical protein FQY83_13335 [Luteimonas marina]